MEYLEENLEEWLGEELEVGGGWGRLGVSQWGQWCSVREWRAACCTAVQQHTGLPACTWH